MHEGAGGAGCMVALPVQATRFTGLSTCTLSPSLIEHERRSRVLSPASPASKFLTRLRGGGKDLSEHTSALGRADASVKRDASDSGYDTQVCYL